MAWAHDPRGDAEEAEYRASIGLEPLPRPTRGRPTTPADLHRLAAKADAAGVRPERLKSSTPHRPQYSCPSSRDEMRTYFVDLIDGCDCLGYAGGEVPETGKHVDGYGRCMHHSKALEIEGWLPDLCDAEHDRIIAAAAKRRRCGWCQGDGLVHDPDGKGAPEPCPNGCPIPTPAELRARRERLAAERERLEAAAERAIDGALAGQSGHPAGAPGLANARAARRERADRQRRREQAATERGERLAQRADESRYHVYP
jgi:hypothetical protein